MIARILVGVRFQIRFVPVEQIPQEVLEEVLLVLVVVVEQRLTLLELVGDPVDARRGIAVLTQRSIGGLHDGLVHALALLPFAHYRSDVQSAAT